MITLLIALTASVGYVLLPFIEPLGYKRLNTTRDILSKSFILGLIILAPTIITGLIFAETSSLVEPKKLQDYLDTIKAIANQYFFISLVVWSLIIYFFIYKKKEYWDTKSLDLILSKGEKTLRDFRGKVSIINVKPNKLYTCIIKNFLDIDGIKGPDIIEIAPIQTRQYDDEGKVKTLRYYNKEKIVNDAITHDNTILIKFEEVTQIRLYSQDLNNIIYGHLQDEDQKKISKKKITEEYKKQFKTKSNDTDIQLLIEEINPEKYYETGSNEDILNIKEIKSLRNIHVKVQDFFKRNNEFTHGSIDQTHKEKLSKIINFSSWVMKKITNKD